MKKGLTVATSGLTCGVEGFPDLTKNNFVKVNNDIRSNNKYGRGLLGESFGEPAAIEAINSLCKVGQYRRTLVEYLYWLKNGIVTINDKQKRLIDDNVICDIILRLDVENSTNIGKNVTLLAMSKIILKVLSSPSNMSVLSSSAPSISEMNVLVWQICDTHDSAYASILSHYDGDPIHAMSLASKFCYYLNEWYFLDNNPFDASYDPNGKSLFSIYDSVLCSHLPHYLDFYGISSTTCKRSKVSEHQLTKLKHSQTGYETYLGYIDQLKKMTHLTSHQIDQIIWWCFR